VIPSSPKENNEKRINYRVNVPATTSSTSPSHVHSTASPPPKILSDTTKIILERRVTELRTEIAAASKRGQHDRAEELHAELVKHQNQARFHSAQRVSIITSSSPELSGSTTRRVSEGAERLTWLCISEAWISWLRVGLWLIKFRPLAAGPSDLSFPSSSQRQPPPAKKPFEELMALYAARDDSNWPIARAYLVNALCSAGVRVTALRQATT
jgi:hypothetical protein